MNQPQNDLHLNSQKNLSHLKDFRLSVTPEPSYKKPDHPLAHPMLECETRSFIVTWQLPGAAYQDDSKSHS